MDIATGGFSGSASSIPYRSEMERGFGQSFANVQAYSGSSAKSANQSMGSEAYAVGNQVAFKSSNPSKAVVAHGLAHELPAGSPHAAG